MARAESWNPLLSLVTFVGECAILLTSAIKRMVRLRLELGQILEQMAFVGIMSVPIVALTTFFSGAVLALYTSDILIRYGAASLSGGTIGLAVTREIAPVLAGIMVAARCGSAMAAQIGSMTVTQQVDALRSLSVDPTDYLVVPRVIAGVVMVPMLCLIGCYAGVIGGYITSVSRGVPGGTFMQSLRQWVQPGDFIGGMEKTVIFGLIVALVACQQGLRTKGGAVGVGKSTTSTVVISMVLIYVADYFLTDIIY